MSGSMSAHNDGIFVTSFAEKCILVSNSLLVDAPAGKIQGTELYDYNAEPFVAFRGIPYAKPPLGDLRFERPQPLEKLESIFDATQPGAECPTPSLPMFSHYKNGDEDCLILNVFMKRMHRPGTMKKVIVFIHGGGFVVGSSIPYIPGTFVNAHDVIFVTINYRLGILGFLSTEDEVSPGNYGLWDIVLALRWVKDNIGAFGGDPNDVTISGESAGGAAVSYLTLAPQAKFLFKKAYAHSGSATSVFGRSTRARKTALEFAMSVGCLEGEPDASATSTDYSRAVIACLKKLPLAEFTKFQAFTLDESKFVPRIDGHIVPLDPLVLLNDSDYLRSVGFFDKLHLIAVDNNERSIMEAHVKLSEMMLSHQLSLSGADAQSMLGALHDSAKRFYVRMRLQNSSHSESALKTVESWYERRYGADFLIDLSSDLNFILPTFDYIEATTKSDVCKGWLLYFNHYPQILKGHRKGIPHGFELLYWFDFPIELMKIYVSDPNIEIMGEEDLKLKQHFSAIISAFVKTGNPSGPLAENIPATVPVYDLHQRSHINFCPSPTLGSDLEAYKREFWEQLALDYL